MVKLTKPVIVLFDVDETWSTPAVRARSWKAAFEKLYGIPADIGAHSSAGETDPQVAGQRSKAFSAAIPATTSSASSTASTCCTWLTTF